MEAGIEKKKKDAYVIEYRSYVGRSYDVIMTVDEYEDVEMVIKAHHAMIAKLYKKWYPALKWEKGPFKDDPFLARFAVDKADSYAPTWGKGKSEAWPKDRYSAMYWCSKESGGWKISSSEDYQVYRFEGKGGRDE